MQTVCVCAKSLQSCLTVCDAKDCSLPGSFVHGFSRQEYWSGLPCPPPGDLPNPGIEPRSPTLQADSLLSEPPGKLMKYYSHPHFLTDSDLHCITRRLTHPKSRKISKKFYLD